jgi:hypothetical protein
MLLPPVLSFGPPGPLVEVLPFGPVSSPVQPKAASAATSKPVRMPCQWAPQPFPITDSWRAIRASGELTGVFVATYCCYWFLAVRVEGFAGLLPSSR